MMASSVGLTGAIDEERGDSLWDGPFACFGALTKRGNTSKLGSWGGRVSDLRVGMIQLYVVDRFVL
jgi:hypothetical protein